MSWIQIALLGLVQGAAELLPVSSSAHVIVVSRLLGFDPSSPQMTFLIVMLHTGTMAAVILYFWKRWKTLFSASVAGRAFLQQVLAATALTGVVGLGMKFFIEKVVFEKIMGHAHAEVEHLFKNLPLIAVALFGVGILIVRSGRRELAGGASASKSKQAEPGVEQTMQTAARIGIVQGFCLPFRGFSRSGATISVGLWSGVSRSFSENFSFALAVVLTPPVIVLELRRLVKTFRQGAITMRDLFHLVAPGLIGMAFSFLAGLLALRWLSAWLEKGRWHYFGYYCIAFSGVVALLAALGY